MKTKLKDINRLLEMVYAGKITPNQARAIIGAVENIKLEHLQRMFPDFKKQ